MMHKLEKSDPSTVAAKSANNSGRSEAESVERREGAKGNTPEPDTEPGERVTGARACTRARQREEGTVHRSASSCDGRSVSLFLNL